MCAQFLPRNSTPFCLSGGEIFSVTKECKLFSVTPAPLTRTASNSPLLSWRVEDDCWTAETVIRSEIKKLREPSKKSRIRVSWGVQTRIVHARWAEDRRTDAKREPTNGVPRSRKRVLEMWTVAPSTVRSREADCVYVGHILLIVGINESAGCQLIVV